MQEAISFTPQLAASPIAEILWLIPALPIVAAGVICASEAAAPQSFRHVGHRLAGFSLLLSLVAFAHVVSDWAHGTAVREVVNFTWFRSALSMWTWAGCSIRCRP